MQKKLLAICAAAFLAVALAPPAVAADHQQQIQKYSDVQGLKDVAYAEPSGAFPAKAVYRLTAQDAPLVIAAEKREGARGERTGEIRKGKSKPAQRADAPPHHLRL